MGKSKKDKKGKKKKKEVEKSPPPPPILNVFVLIRRQNVTLCLETHEEMTVKELKVQVATILRQFPEDITLMAMLGKQPEEMEDMEKPPEKKDPSKMTKEEKEKAEAEKDEEERPPAHMQIGAYGYRPGKSSVFNPQTIGLCYRGDDGTEFEKLEITPYGEFTVIPEEIKMHLRNYVPPPPPKKGRKQKPPA